MIRSEVLKTLIPMISDQLVVSNIGLPSQELHLLDDQPTNFYMLGTMGLASSIGLGLALAQKAKVIAIDGDGSVLTNFGTLPTIANNPAKSLSRSHAKVTREAATLSATGRDGRRSRTVAMSSKALARVGPSAWVR